MITSSHKKIYIEGFLNGKLTSIPLDQIISVSDYNKNVTVIMMKNTGATFKINRPYKEVLTTISSSVIEHDKTTVFGYGEEDDQPF